ncbi:MAG: hypothetical protein E4H07_04990 [Nitrosomonadales bacterium]|nr:MAG: hypothetical protein E4H07_04990 [Nitrosomonadales bacterium]
MSQVKIDSEDLEQLKSSVEVLTEQVEQLKDIIMDLRADFAAVVDDFTDLVPQAYNSYLEALKV